MTKTQTPKLRIDWEAHEKASSYATLRAIEFIAREVPPKYQLPPDLRALGHEVASQGHSIFDRLRALHGEEVDTVISIALKELWFAHLFEIEYRNVYRAANGLSEPARGLKRYDLCVALYEGIQDQGHMAARVAFYAGTKFTGPLDIETAMYAFALFSFAEADKRLILSNVEGAMDHIHHAYSAICKLREHQARDVALASLRENPGAFDHGVATSRSAFGKAGAQARHKENRAMKKDVFEWCDANMASVSSMDAAASRVAGTLVPAAWRTVRDWMTEWKRLRSAGTP